MAKKQFYKRQRNPIILLVCEGKNKTERKYFSHYQVRESHYRLAIKDSEATDVMGMARHAANIYKEYQMDPAIGDLAFCLIDLDLRRDKYDAYLKAKQKYPQVRFIVSNPCFEIWLLYYFTENPKTESSSQAVKEQMKRYVPAYNEAMDVYDQCDLEDKYAVAINRSEKKNAFYEEDKILVERNPYTEVQDLILILKQHYQDKQLIYFFSTLRLFKF